MQKLIKIILFFLIFLGFIARLWQFDANPISLYWDEVAIGLEAKSLASTGLDINGKSALQTMFYSYGDYKAPVYIWLTSFFANFFPVNQVVVRLPSLLAGLATGFFLLKLTQLLFKKKSLLPPLSLAMYSIMPWSVHFSRIGMESHLSLFWLTLSIYLLVKAKLSKKSWLLILSAFSISLGIYTYISLRIIGPLLFIISFILFHQKNKKTFAFFSLSLVIIAAFSLILVRSPQYTASQNYRLSNNNLVTSTTNIDKSLTAKGESNTIPSRLFHHRYLYKAEEYLKNYFSHFDFKFLGLQGDQNLRHHSGFYGQILTIQSLILIIGLFVLFGKLKKPAFKLILAWLLLSPTISSLVNEVPHASRSIYFIVPLSLVIGLGLSKLKPKLLLILLGLLLLNFSFYAHDYFAHYPSRSNLAWINPYKQAALYLKDNPVHQDVYVTPQYYQPGLYFQFYANKTIHQLGSTCPDQAICITEPDFQPDQTQMLVPIPNTDKLVIKQNL